MNWQVLRLLYLHELRMLVRGRRTVVMALVIPAVVMPIMLYASKYTQDAREQVLTQTTYTYAITGTMTDRVRDLLQQARSVVKDDESEEAAKLREFKALELRVADPLQSLQNREIHFLIETYTGEEADARVAQEDATDSSPAGLPAGDRVKRLKGVPLVRIFYRGNNDASNSSSKRIEDLLRFAQRRETQTLLLKQGFHIDPRYFFATHAVSVATPEQVTASTIGRFLTAFLVMLMLAGGSIAAMDIIAGEKERGTLETLLTTAAGRNEIVAGKQLAICTVAIVITLIQVVNFLVYMKLEIVQMPPDFALQIPGATIVLLLLLFIPLAATIAAVLLMISAYAKTYKEAQMYFLPLYLVSLLPALAAVLPGLPLRSVAVLIPLVNVSVAVREILMDRIDAPMLGITFAVMFVTSILVMRASARMLSREDIIVPSQGEPEAFLGGTVLFRKRVLRWFAVMWALVFAVAGNIPQLATFRAQLLFNEFVVFGGATVLMIWIYRLKPRKALALHPVKWPVWIAVVLAAPAGNLMGVAVFKLLNYVVPIPQRLIEQLSALVPQDIPTWQLYILIGLIPGVVEELAFRGILLHGLRRRVRPLFLPIVVGIIFGLFHFTLFRIGPTAFLGMLLTIVAMLTGSVLPGIVLHALNNSFAIWAADNAWPLTALEPWHYIAATVVFALCMWIVYRNRQPRAGPA